MIIFGDNQIVPYLLVDRERYFILNFFNPTNLGTRLDKLWPPNIIMQAADMDSKEFDIMYANYLLSNDEAFQDFMEILMALYYNNDVFILTDLNSTPVVAMYESIIKLIQQRYGYNCYVANCPEDVINIPESTMSEYGHLVFMEDKERYTYLSTDAEELLKNLEIVGGESDKCI